MHSHQLKRTLLLSSVCIRQLLRRSLAKSLSSEFLKFEMQMLVSSQSLLLGSRVSSYSSSFFLAGTLSISFFIWALRCFFISISLCICSFWCLRTVTRSLMLPFYSYAPFFFFPREISMPLTSPCDTARPFLNFYSFQTRAGLLVSSMTVVCSSTFDSALLFWTDLAGEAQIFLKTGLTAAILANADTSLILLT